MSDFDWGNWTKQIDEDIARAILDLPDGDWTVGLTEEEVRRHVPAANMWLEDRLAGIFAQPDPPAPGTADRRFLDALSVPAKPGTIGARMEAKAKDWFKDMPLSIFGSTVH